VHVLVLTIEWLGYWFIGKQKYSLKYVSKEDRQCTYNVTLRRVRATIVAAKKAISITSCDCMFISSMQCACAMLSSVAWTAVQYFAHYLKKRYDFRKKKVFEHTEKKILNMKYVLILSAASVWNVPRSRKNWARCEHKVPVTLVRFKRNLNFLDMFSRNI